MRGGTAPGLPLERTGIPALARRPLLPLLMNRFFDRLSQWTAAASGSARAFAVAAAALVVWAALGPFYQFSDTWQLVINTGTTIVTFLMVFLIQHTQNRDAAAIQLKLDELIRALKGARNRMIDLENCSEDELVALKEQFERLSHRVGAKRTPRRRRAGDR